MIFKIWGNTNLIQLLAICLSVCPSPTVYWLPVRLLVDYALFYRNGYTYWHNIWCINVETANFHIHKVDEIILHWVQGESPYMQRKRVKVLSGLTIERIRLVKNFLKKSILVLVASEMEQSNQGTVFRNRRTE